MKKIALVVSLLIASPLPAQTVEERLARLEQEVLRLSAENVALRQQLDASMKPAASAPAAPVAKSEVVVHPSGKEAQVQIGGLIQAQGESGDRVDARFSDDNDRIYLRRLRLSTNGRFAEDFDFRVESEFAGSLSAAAGLRGQLTDAYLNWTRHPMAQVRAGQFKAPFGYEQLASDARLGTPERSLGSDRITVGRQLGVMMYGDLAGKRASYSIGAFNGTGTNTSANDDEGFLTAARFAATLWSRGKGDTQSSWTAGVNGLRSEDRAVSVAPELQFAANTFAGRRTAWGVDSQLHAGRAELAGELLRGRYAPATGGARDLRSWWLLAGWMFHPRVQGVVRYEDFDAPLTETKTLTVGTSYFIRGNDLKLQLFYLRSDDDRGRVIARVQTVF